MTLPLEGIRILDLSRLLPGPSASMLLADLGAEVIKVESPELIGARGHDVLSPNDPTPENERRYAAWNSLARNKRSLVVNLKAPAGQRILYGLAKTADVLLEGFRPGVTKRLGVDYETLRAINPRLIYCSISGYGQSGPYANLAGHDPCYASVAGVMAVTSDDAGHPVGTGVQLVDYASGLFAALGILAALRARDLTGRGQFVDVSMLDSAMHFITAYSGFYFRDGIVPKRGRPNLTVLRTKDGKYIATANREPHFWENFCRAIGAPELIAARTPGPFGGEPTPEAVERVRAIIATKTRDEWFAILREADTCVAPVLEIDEVFEDPQVRHRQMVLELDHPTEGRVRQIGFPLKLSETPATFRHFAPERGRDTVALLRELGYSDDEIAELERQRVVVTWRGA